MDVGEAVQAELSGVTERGELRAVALRSRGNERTGPSGPVHPVDRLANGQLVTGSFARWRCMAALRDRLTRPWRSISMTTTITSSPTDTTSSTVGT
jgi:hypothetical protein